ncbi:MAG: 3-isopropylmalate dehydratase large subunit [Candidatus Omnitrophica bacterium]|nr:3-isopropylmalate dehydratase large subunit [Candidatus Omnitrophota bacterium]
MGQTIAEKILSGHCGKKVKADDIAVCKVDFYFGQDGTSGIIIDNFRKLGNVKPADKTKFYMVIDHSGPSPSVGVSTIHKKMRSFAEEYGVGLYDVGEGVCHQLMPELGHVVPGDLVIGADSHTCTYGAINVFSTGVGSTDLAITLATGKNWFRVPRTVKMIIKGRLPNGVYSKDIILHIIGQVGANGCTYKSVEFYGSAIEGLSVDSRFTISNMAVEMGAKCGIMEADKKVLDWINRIKKHSQRRPRPVFADIDAVYEAVKEFDVSRLAPQVAKPHTVDNVSPVDEVKGKQIDQAYIGTCTNGRFSDLETAARILKNKKINPDVKLIIAPASRNIYLEALKAGIIEVFIKAGGVVLSPGCGPCVGTQGGIPADGETVISTANRNFKGRMGNPNAFIYLASPATCAASALEGRIADPRRYV